MSDIKLFMEALGGGALAAVIVAEFLIIWRLWSRCNELVDMLRTDAKEATALHAATAKETARSIDMLSDAVKDIRRG